MTWDEVVAVGLKLPGVEVSTSYGTPSLKAYGKFLTRLRTEDQSLVLVGVGFDERDFLVEAEPATFHITPHYKDYPAVLARLERVDAGTVAQLLERRWRKVAPKRAVTARDAARADASLFRLARTCSGHPASEVGRWTPGTSPGETEKDGAASLFTHG